MSARKTKLTNEERYAAVLQANVRALWSGAITRAQFISLMMAAVQRYLMLAWAEGAQDEDLTGLLDLTYEEAAALQELIWMEWMFVDRFADDIVERDEAGGFPLGPFIRRTDLWVNRFASVRIKAQVMARADEKSEWRLGFRKEHCRSCVKLHGITKRNSTWASAGILPRVAGAPYLDCHGWLCACSLYPTSDPITPGPLPPLP